MLRCDCGKELKDYRGARGHVQFSSSDPHGEHGTVPDEWRDLFTELDRGDEPDHDEPEPDHDDDDDDDDDEPDRSPVDRADAAAASRIKRALTDDVRALWGGDE